MTKILLVAINAKYIHSNPAVYSLYAYARKWKEYIEVVQYNINQQPSDILADIYRRKPNVVAISCYIWNMQMVERLLPNLHQLLPDTDLWLGGPEVSFDAPKRLKEHSELTGIMIGEGEQTFSELVEHYVSRRSKHELLGIDGLCLSGALTDAKERVYVQKMDNNQEAIYSKEPVFTKERHITDIDSIPFIYPIIGIDNFKNQIVYYESSRGCPFRCSYCLSSIDKQVRLRSLDLVLPELQFFLDNQVPQVKFIDRTFNCNKEHALAIWKYILEHDNGITNFHFEIAADILTEEELELIGQMRPGLIQLEIGVQSTNQDTIREINRVMNLDKVRANVAAVRSFNNTHQHLDLIAGLPYEGKESFIKSFNDVYSMEPDQLQLGFLKVLKGSYIEAKKQEYEIKHTNEPSYEVFSTKWISFDEILELKKIEEMVELYYNSGQFKYTINLFERVFDSAYEIYEKMAEFYEEKGYFLQTPARSYRYNVLYEFGKLYIKDERLLSQTLTFDMYLRERCKSRVDFALDLQPWKNEINSLFIDRRLKKNHIDVFEYSVWDNEPKKLARPAFVYFDYDNRDPLSHNAVFEVINNV